jgi:hypothetical protein
MYGRDIPSAFIIVIGYFFICNYKGVMQSILMLQTMHATLLKRIDASLYCIYVGADWARFAEQLGHGHCFEVQPLLVIPNLTIQTQQRFDAYNLGTNKGWFEELNHEHVL